MASPLENRVLVLNRGWQPVNIVGVRRAITLLFQEHAQVIFSDPQGGHQMLDAAAWIEFSQNNPAPERSIHTVRLTLRIPPVLLLTGYDRIPKRGIRFSRHNVYLRDNHCCQYCGQHCHAAELTLDHVVPRERGGKTTWENIVTACVRCNARKANRLPQQAGMALRRAPARPKWGPFMAAAMATEEAGHWQPFLGNGKN